MSKYTLPYFEEIDINNLESYYDVTIELNNREVEIDLNFDESSITQLQLDIVKDFLNNLPKLYTDAYEAIKEDYNNSDDTVKEYIEHHIEELDSEELVSLIGVSGNDTYAKSQLLSKLYLRRIGFYPDVEDAFIILDYTIGDEITNYLIVVTFTKDGAVDGLSMES